MPAGAHCWAPFALIRWAMWSDTRLLIRQTDAKNRSEKYKSKLVKSLFEDTVLLYKPVGFAKIISMIWCLTNQTKTPSQATAFSSWNLYSLQDRDSKMPDVLNVSTYLYHLGKKKKITFKMKNNGLQKYNIYSVVKKDCQLWWCQLDMCCTLAVWTQISFCSINHYIRRFYLQCQSLVKMCIFINFLK